MSNNRVSKKERKKEWRQRKRLWEMKLDDKVIEAILKTGPALDMKNGYGVVDLTAYNASRRLREEPEKIIFSRGKLREC
jgi:hypothetical protein